MSYALVPTMSVCRLLARLGLCLIAIVALNVSPANGQTITSPRHGQWLSDSTPVIQGKASPSATVRLQSFYDGQSCTWCIGYDQWTQADARGNFSFTTSLALRDSYSGYPFNQARGEYTFKVSSNTGSASVSFFIDTETRTPELVYPKDQSCFHFNKRFFTMKMEDDSSIYFSVNGQVQKALGYSSMGNLLPLESDGTYTITVQTQDKAGNISFPTDPITVTVDSVSPNQPIIVAPTQGEVGVAQAPSIKGKAEPNTSISVSGVEATDLSTKSDAAGNWSVTATKSLPNGMYFVRVIATDCAGNRSAEGNISFRVGPPPPTETPTPTIDPNKPTATPTRNPMPTPRRIDTPVYANTPSYIPTRPPVWQPPQQPPYRPSQPHESMAVELLRDIRATPTPAAHSFPAGFVQAADGVYFLDSYGGLWFSDGTRSGTRQIPLKDLDYGLTLQKPRAMTAWKDTLVFGATFEDPTGNASGCQSSSSSSRSCSSEGLFMVNPYKTGVKLIRGKIYIEGSPSGRPNLATILTTSNYIIFFAEESHSSSSYRNNAVWASDGTRAGTVLVDPIDDGSRSIDERVVVGDVVFFVIPGSSKLSGLWRTNGTKAGTFILSTTQPETLLSHRGKLYYVNHDYSSYKQPYALNSYDPLTNSTATARFGEFYYSRSEPNLVPAGGFIYFLTYGSNSIRQQIWKVDENSLGLTMVGEFEKPGELTNYNESLFFVATDPALGRELHRYSPSSGARPIDVRPGLSGSSPEELTPSMGYLFFSADSGNEGQELWRLDSSSLSPNLAKDIWPGLNGSKPTNLFGTNNFLIFAADNGRNGVEPWVATFLPLGSLPPSKPDASPGSSGVYASPLPASGRWNQSNLLRYRVAGASSSREYITIYRPYGYSPIHSFTSGWAAISPRGSSWSVTLPAKRLRAGSYKWCVRPEGPQSSFGATKCATLKLR